MQKQGVNITLGTDGCASNNNLNLLEEVKLTSVLHKGITGNAAICPPAEIMKYATQNGAAAQGRPDTGCIKVGNKADFAVLNCDKPYWYPSHDKLNDLETKLSDAFVRIHNRYLIHLKYLSEIQGNQAIVDGESLPVSRSCISALSIAFAKFMLQ